MDSAAIIALIGKGLAMIVMLIQAEQDAMPAIKALISLATGAQAGAITQSDMDTTEALLDKMIDDFNLDLPPETP